MVLAETGCNFVCVKPLRQNDLYTIDICTCFSDVPVICVSPVSILCRCQHPVYFDQQLWKRVALTNKMTWWLTLAISYYKTISHE